MLENFEITAEELQESLQKKDSLLIFDLRLQDIYKNGHIKGAVHAVCDAKAKETIMPNIPKDVRIVLVDEGGLIASAYYLKGGMKGWNKEIVKGGPHSSIESDNCKNDAVIWTGCILFERWNEGMESGPESS